MRTILLSLLSTVVLAAGCADPAANKPKAQVSEPTANNSASKPADVKAEGTQLAITPENSKVEFVGSKVTGKHDGGFKTFKGTINLVGEKPELSTVTVEIDTKSVFTDTDALTTHLKSADFFDVAKFPAATFTSTKVEPDATKGAGNYTVTGDLDLHGVKKVITFPATISVTPDQVAVTAEFSINRKDFGIVYAGKPDDLIRDLVVMKLDLKTPRKK